MSLCPLMPKKRDVCSSTEGWMAQKEVRKENTENSKGGKKEWAEHMILNGRKEQVERQPIWDMVQPFLTHNSFSLRIPQCFTFFPYKSLLLAHSDPGAAGQDTSCLDSHNGAGARDIQKSLEILISTFSMFSTDISLEGFLSSTKYNWFRFAKCYYNLYLYFSKTFLQGPRMYSPPYNMLQKPHSHCTHEVQG